MNHRFTHKEPSGTWGVNGEDFKNMSTTMYQAMSELLHYEETGLSPDEVEEMQDELEKVRVGGYIQSYQIIGMYGNYCIGHSRTAPDPYVVWTIDADRYGVHNGRYRLTKEEAVQKFLELGIDIKQESNEEQS